MRLRHGRLGTQGSPAAALAAPLQGADLSEPDCRNELSLSQQQLALMDSIVDQAADLL